jgi:adenine deaminase
MNIVHVYVGLFLLFTFLSSETVDDILTLMAMDLADLTKNYYNSNNTLSSLSAGNDTRTLILEGATLIDGTGAPPESDAVIVINDGKIIEVTNQTNYNDNLYFNGSNGTQTSVSLTGKYIIPGLFDTHAHVAGVLKDSYD